MTYIVIHYKPVMRNLCHPLTLTLEQHLYIRNILAIRNEDFTVMSADNKHQLSTLQTLAMKTIAVSCLETGSVSAMITITDKMLPRSMQNPFKTVLSQELKQVTSPEAKPLTKALITARIIGTPSPELFHEVMDEYNLHCGSELYHHVLNNIVEGPAACRVLEGEPVKDVLSYYGLYSQPIAHLQLWSVFINNMLFNLVRTHCMYKPATVLHNGPLPLACLPEKNAGKTLPGYRVRTGESCLSVAADCNIPTAAVAYLVLEMAAVDGVAGWQAYQGRNVRHIATRYDISTSFCNDLLDHKAVAGEGSLAIERGVCCDVVIRCLGLRGFAAWKLKAVWFDNFHHHTSSKSYPRSAKRYHMDFYVINHAFYSQFFGQFNEQNMLFLFSPLRNYHFTCPVTGFRITLP